MIKQQEGAAAFSSLCRCLSKCLCLSLCETGVSSDSAEEFTRLIAKYQLGALPAARSAVSIAVVTRRERQNSGSKQMAGDIQPERKTLPGGQWGDGGNSLRRSTQSSQSPQLLPGPPHTPAVPPGHPEVDASGQRAVPGGTWPWGRGGIPNVSP